MMIPYGLTFAQIKIWLDELADGVAGDACAVSQAGEPYVEISFTNLARPGDEGVIEAVTAAQLQRALNSYFEGRSGTIYWRIPLEWEIKEDAVVARYDDNGPDIDFTTNQKCVLDRNWMRVSCYVRLYRARCVTMKQESAAA